MKNKTVPVYQFKITLQGVDPSIWRRVQVPASITLFRLASVLILSMGWNGSHLHQFRIGGKSYGIPDDEFETVHKIIDEQNIKLKNLEEADLKAFLFEYDFGDGWKHTVEMEEHVFPDEKIKYPICVGGMRRCPPDDLGGARRYEAFLEAIKNPTHLEHESMLRWIGGSFESEAFDASDANKELEQVEKMEKIWWGDDEEDVKA